MQDNSDSSRSSRNSDYVGAPPDNIPPDNIPPDHTPAVTLLSEDELALIHALQLRPRASWSELGSVLGVDPVTAARRWQRLSGRHEAWVGISPGPRLFDRVCAAYIDIDCAAGEAGAVARALSAHPHMLTIERAAGAHRLLATVATRDLAAMSRYTLDVLPVLPHVTGVHARLITHMFTEGGDWRIDALAPDQRTQLTPAPAKSAPARDRSQITDTDRVLLALLARDGRATHAALATVLGISAATVKRRMDELVRLGLLRFRCDFARPLGGWPVAVTFWATAPAGAVQRIGQALVALPETRNCAAVSGTHNLALQASLHSVADVLRFETQLAASHPELSIAERVVSLRHDKLLGRVLDPQGRSISVVVPDIWGEPGRYSGPT
ncbi:Lrp/AsnC family transcriptional regulator [Nocardia huaxiensis]|uniref:Lrp/AsnC family transcriptional regulator n=1 Tax=Nocardia huaxiensis TaxID=2755382 RepID=A0A7D6VED3_9NOCA|nr:Lrp/AsnC family transcriptional regulator [Nocardia huaxiensis]QLY30535.1 Lrp/AsnC family transcriptional regulator [Nocardia huaxiensis]UFS95862.1 Lrp/AsnC family transcriptional regulator [Nocardia huaxiensis]